MPRSDPASRTYRVHAMRMFVVALLPVLLMFASWSFRADFARGQANTPAASAGNAPVWQATIVITHTNTVDSVAWSPDGSKLVSGDRDDRLHVWDATTGASLLTMSGHSRDVSRVAWSPDGSKIASVSDDMSVRIWDAATGSSLHTLTGHSGRLDSVLWSPDSAKVVSASPIDESVRVWDATTGANLLTLTPPSLNAPTSVAWSPDGAKLASTTNDRSILVWDGATGDTILTFSGFEGTPTQLAWSPDGSKMAAGSYDRRVRVWDATTGNNLLTIDNGGIPGGVAWSPDGSKLVSTVAEGADDSVKVWDATTGAALQTFAADLSLYSPVLWSPDGSKITSATWNLLVLMWDAATGADLTSLTGHGNGITGAGNVGMVWSPDGSRLATAGAETVIVWAEAAAVAPVAATPTTAPTTAATVAPTSAATSTPAATATPTGTPDPNALAFEPPILEFVWAKGSRNPASQRVLGRNVGPVSYGAENNWINIPATKYVSGGFQMDISVNPGAANLDVGVHEGRVNLTSNGKTITLPVKITVTSPDGTLQVNRKQLNFGGFVGDPIADRGVGLTFTGLGSTNWTASGPPWLTLAPASGSVAATAPTTLTIGINSAAVSAAGRYSDTLTVSDGKTTHKIAVELSLVAPGAPTIQLFGLEVTQGLQNLYNDLPVVANRPVFVRGHVRSLTGNTIEKVTAQLVGTRDGVDLGTLSPINPGGQISVVDDPKRNQLNESFLFELPPSWRTGTVTLHLKGQSQPIACVDPAEKSAANGVGDDCTVTLTYETLPVTPITYILYKDLGEIVRNGATTGTYTFVPTADHAGSATRAIMAALPLAGVDQQIHGTILNYSGGLRNDTNSVNKALDEINKLYKQAGEPRRHYYGLFARYPTTSDPKDWSKYGPGGMAALAGFHGVGEFATDNPYATLNAHELGHNFGREHAPCGPAGNPDPKFPHPQGQISDAQSGNEAYFGFNIYTKDIYPPTHKDLMTYCWPQWISPYTYKAVIERLKIHYNSQAASSGTGPLGASPSEPILLINGSITDTTTGSIEGVVGDNGILALPATDASAYSVRLEDASGQTIATYPVMAQVAEGQNHEEFTSYAVAVPRPDDLARVVLLHQDQPLAERVASANAPTISLTTVVSGEIFDIQPLAITWEAGDADGDELRFNVDYSTDDGVTWRKLTWDWTENTLVVDSADLPGSTQARIRVSANDGFLTTFAESETFTVIDHAPIATILSTDLNRYYVGGQTILLEGIGYDPEDGMVNDLTWYSDRNGVLGSGPTLALNADDLAEGTHLIRLEAKDSTGQSSFGDPALGIAAPDDFGTSNDTVSFDILYDPLTLPAELAVAPNMLGFSFTPGATQLLTDTVTVSNLGDGELGWTASSDAANVTLSSSGSTPATVVVSVDPTGLAEGLHRGTVTFTPALTPALTPTEATLAPVTVDYFINVYPPSPLEIAQNNAYRVEFNAGGDESPWEDHGVWVIGGRLDQRVVALDIASSDDGQSLGGTVTYAGEGPIAFRATATEQNVYLVEVHWGGADAPWNPQGTWVLGSNADQGLTALNLVSEDEGNTLDGTMSYGEGTLLGLRATLQPISTVDEAGATSETASEQADAAPQFAMCDATDVPVPTHGGVTVRFVNASGAIAVVYWRDFNGNLVEYHRLDPDGFADQATFETHEWVIEDEAGNVLLDYVASADATQCVLIEQP